LVVWEVEVTDEFLQWWSGLTADQLYDTYRAELRDEGLI
jgi:hypothetical protein